jgi:hypothetical protein
MECWDKLAVENYGYPLARTNWLLRLRRSKCFLIISESLAGCGLCSNYVGLAIWFPSASPGKRFFCVDYSEFLLC